MRIVLLMALLAALVPALAHAEGGTKCEPVWKCTPSGCVYTWECR